MKIFNWIFSNRRQRVPPTLEAIFISTKAGAPMQFVTSVEARIDAGLQGDRYSDDSGFWKATDACQVTLISEDDLNQAKHGCTAVLQGKLENGGHRRNLVVAGIKTKQLEGKTFRIGQAIFSYYKHRPPCAYLDKIVGEGISRALGKHSGVCLCVIQSGKLSLGDRIEIINVAEKNKNT